MTKKQETKKQEPEAKQAVQDEAVQVVQDEQAQEAKSAPVQAEPQTSKKAKGKQKIKVTGPKRGRRRASFSFSDVPTVLEINKLSDEELFAIENDPMLVVEVL